MKFRTDIQILRGISVLYVVLFHLGIQSIQSGFLGVDVFFVISGFLMAVLYDGSDVKGFFVRRANRLLPAYFVVILITLLISFIINTPNESNQVASQAIFGAAFISNIGFWLQNSYFSKSEFNPLLHLWSLGVEIQFYLIVPVLAYLFYKVRFSFIFIFLTSMVLCFFILTISPKTSFFMMPLRIWEFLLGYGCALYFTSNGEVKYSSFKWLGGLGLFLIFTIPILNVDGESLNIVSGHPGLTALLVSSATCMVLMFGLPKSIESNFLSEIITTLGKYSYSIYLVHFPIIVIYLSKPFGGTILNISTFYDLLAILLMISLSSIVLHKFVEVNKFKLHIFKLSALFMAITIVLALSLPLIKSLIISTEERNIFNAFYDRSEYRCGKIFRIVEPGALSCNLNKKSSSENGRILLVGNSHADSIKTTFEKVASQNGISTYFIVQNNPLMPGGLLPEDIVNEAKVKNIKHIVVHFSPDSFTIDNIKRLALLSLEKSIKVSFIDPVPVWNRHIPEFMYLQLKNPSENLKQTKYDYLKSNEMLFSELNELKNENFERFTVVENLCKPDCIYTNEEGIPLYFDSGHLTLTGSSYLEDIFEKIVERNINTKAI